MKRVIRALIDIILFELILMSFFGVIFVLIHIRVDILAQKKTRSAVEPERA
ncbi:hypothetical protein N826_07660 [Skermanella aerolata KACC 11604]|nr:hypothetical protein N826_07660 [Skermanella aerolata KACC 11604]